VRTKEKLSAPPTTESGKGYQAAHPFFGGFLAELQSETLSDTRSELFDHLLFSQILPKSMRWAVAAAKPQLAFFHRVLWLRIHRADRAAGSGAA